MRKSRFYVGLGLALAVVGGTAATILLDKDKESKAITSASPADSGNKPELNAEVDKQAASSHSTDPANPTPKSDTASTSPGSVSIPKGTRQKAKGDKVTACTPVYEELIEIRSNPSLAASLKSKGTDECLAELSKVIRNFDDLVKEVMECGRKPKDGEAQSEDCHRVALIFYTAFVENEFKGSDPSDIPSPVLRAMVLFRALQMEKYSKNESDLDYFYRLVSEEQRLSPDEDMSSLRSTLIGELVKSNPDKYESEYDSAIVDIERKSPESGLSARIARYNGQISDPTFQDELEEFIQRNPQSAYGYYIKAAVLANKEDWAGADAQMAKALTFAEDKKFYEKERARFAAKEKGYTSKKSFSISL